MSILQNIFNWLCDDANFIKAFHIMLVLLIILLIFTGVYFDKGIDKRNERKWLRRSRMRTNWEPKRPNDLTNSYDNPWDVLEGNAESGAPRKSNFGLIKFILLVSILAVLAIVIFLIANRMG